MKSSENTFPTSETYDAWELHGWVGEALSLNNNNSLRIHFNETFLHSGK
jgi:hypothetical protein